MSGLETGMENGMFWSKIGSGFGEHGGTPPPGIPRSTSPPPPPSTPGLNGHTLGYHPQPEKLESSATKIIEHNKQHHGKGPFNTFHWSDHILGFHSQTEKLEPPCNE